MLETIKPLSNFRKVKSTKERIMKQSIRLIAMIALGALWFGVSAYGQVTTATIYGNVLDPSGAAVAQAAVLATNELTGVSFNATSDEQGEFT